MSTQIDRLTELAKEDPKRQFYSIAHMITPEALYAAFRGLRKKASAGVDGVTYDMYERDAARNIQALHERLKNGKYQAQPLRRVYIRKEDGKQRPLSIPGLEDKIVQKATAEILNAIYEQDFLDCSYGFRPGRGQHQALDEVRRVSNRRMVPREPTRTGGRAAENPKRQAPGSLPILRSSDELPKYPEVLSGGLSYLEEVAQPAHSWQRDDVGEI